LIFHEGDFSIAEQDRVRHSLAGNSGTIVSFVRLAESDFKEPQWVSPEIVKANRTLVPGARGIKYRTMCRWWLKHLPAYLGEYDIYMRLDDDAYLNDIISDPIEAVLNSGVDYASNCLHIEHPLNSLGISSFSRRVLGCSPRLNGLFLPATLESNQLTKLAQFAADLPQHLREVIDLEKIETPIMYYNNFHIARRHIWEHKKWKDYVAAIDESEGQYYLRWGDASVQTIAMLALGFSIGRLDFRYSKRHERRYDAFVNSNHPVARSFMDAGIKANGHQAGSMTRFSSFNLMLHERGIADIAQVIGREGAGP
jgi:hypothetical protein